MHARIRIEHAHGADYPALAAFLTAAGLDPQRLDCAQSHWLVARQGNDIVGCGALLVEAACGHIHSLAVAASHRGRSIGSTLLGVLVDYANERQALSVYACTCQAADFFRRMCWQTVEDAGNDAESTGEQHFTLSLASLQRTA